MPKKAHKTNNAMLATKRLACWLANCWANLLRRADETGAKAEPMDQEPQNSDQPPVSPGNPLAAVSDDSLIATIAQMTRELIRRNFEQVAAGNTVGKVSISRPIPFSRGEGLDYLRIVELWGSYIAQARKTIPARPCPACKSTISRYNFRSYDSYDYHTCTQCGTWFVPLEIDDNLIEAFLDATPEARKLSDDMMRGRDERTQDSDRQRFADYFDMLKPLLHGRDHAIRYLDIGCGVGHSVELARESGWDALGIELNEVAVETAKKRGRNVVHSRDCPDAAIFDVITLFETLEHITDPDPVIAQAASLLDRNGVLCVTVPNRSCFEVSILRERCFHVFGGSENVGHINLFDPSSLSLLLQRHGLKLMFTDGQFGSDFLQIAWRLTGDERSATDLVGKGKIDLSLPEPLFALMNNLGPALALIERTVKRSPILLAIACRAEDEEAMKDAFARLRETWQGEIERLLEAI